MSLMPMFWNRNFSVPIPQSSSIDFQVNSLRWAAIGGPVEASLTAYGLEMDLWEMIELLRCPVVIKDGWDRAVWWGYVAEARVRVGAIEVGATIDSLQNAVAVAYS